MIKKIERPFIKELDVYKRGTSNEVFRFFNEWFDTHVEPVNKMLSEGVELEGFYDPKQKSVYEFCSTWDASFTPTHKTLLIGIEPIKKETAVDILRDFVKEIECGSGTKPIMADKGFSLLQRAKAVLKESGE